MAKMRRRDRSFGGTGQERRERRTWRCARDAVLVKRRRQHAVSNPSRIGLPRAESAKQRTRVEKRRLCIEARGGRVAGPSPARRRAAESRSHRVKGHVARELEQVALVSDQP